MLQATPVFAVTVFENIVHGRARATVVDVEDTARAAAANDVIGSVPNDYEKRVGQRGRRLSDGRRQRGAGARAMVRDAPVLDAGRAVDTGTRAELLGRCALYRGLSEAPCGDVVRLPVEALS